MSFGTILAVRGKEPFGGRVAGETADSPPRQERPHTGSGEASFTDPSARGREGAGSTWYQTWWGGRFRRLLGFSLLSLAPLAAQGPAKVYVPLFQQNVE